MNPKRGERERKFSLGRFKEGGHIRKAEGGASLDEMRLRATKKVSRRGSMRISGALTTPIGSPLYEEKT